MIHGSLFTGIGGFDLAAEWMGWTNSFQCEKDPFCLKVLAKNFPDADRYTDIKQFDARRYRGTVDVLSGGFPCQPASTNGKRKGAEDDRWLWPETMRIIDEVRAPWFVGENVAGLVTLGLDTVLFDLEAANYEVQTFILPACSVGAPHQRDRVWIVAYSDSAQFERCQRRAVASEPKGRPGFGGFFETVAYSPSQRREEFQCVSFADGPQKPANSCLYGAGNRADFRLTEPPLCGPDDGLPAGLVRVSTRAKQLHAYGNSIVPQVAYEIFQAIDNTAF